MLLVLALLLSSLLGLFSIFPLLFSSLLGLCSFLYLVLLMLLVLDLRLVLSPRECDISVRLDSLERLAEGDLVLPLL